MTAELTTIPQDEPVRFWPIPDLAGLGMDPLLAEAMREEPVCRIRLPYGEGEAWLVTRYEDVRFVTSDPRFSRAACDGVEFTRMTPHRVALEGAVGYADPPEHTRLRKAVAKAFTTRTIKRWRAWTQRLMDGIADDMLRDGPPADLMERVHDRLPLAVVSEVTGAPEAERERLMDLTRLMLSSGRDRAVHEQARDELGRWFDRLLRLRREEPGEDLTSVLAAATAQGDLEHREAMALCVIIQISGALAIQNNSANMMYALLTHPAQADRLRAEPELLPRAVEELLRWIPHRSGVGLPRMAVEDVTVGGVPIRAGELVYVSYLTANRDPEVFARPDDLDLGRDAAAHLSFGHGPHRCLGAALARMESEVIVSTMLRRFPGLRLAVPASQIPWQRRVLIRGPESLPVTWGT